MSTDRHCTRVDEAQIARQAAGEARLLWERLEQVPPHWFTPKGG